MFRSLNEFVLRKARAPLWVFGWAVFVAAFSFALHFYVSAHERVGEFGRGRASIDRQLIEEKQVRRVDDTFTAALTASESATRFYKNHLADLEPEDRLSEDLLKSGAKLVSEARRGIATAAGTIDGIEFADDQLNRYTRGLRRILDGIDRSMGVLEEFFGDYFLNGPGPALRKLKAAHTWIFSGSTDAVAAFTRLRSWNDTTVAFSGRLGADIEYLQTALRSFTLRLWISAVAVVYCVGFVSFALHSCLGARFRR